MKLFVVVDPDNVLWSLWSHKDVTEQSIYWDHETANKDITEYLINKPISIPNEIDSPSGLSFSLSHGYLFDQANPMSSLSPFLKKGRKIETLYL